MGGIDDLMPQSNDRWASAARRAQGIADNGLGEALKTYYTRYLPAGVVILVATGTVGGALAFGNTLADWPDYIAVGCLLAVLGVIIGGLVYNAKKIAPAANPGRVDVLLSLEDEERKDIRRQILGKKAVDPEHLVISRGAAVQMRKNFATQILWAPLIPLAFLPQAMDEGNPVRWLMATGVVLVMVGIVATARDFRRAGPFLARTGEQATRNASL